MARGLSLVVHPHFHPRYSGATRHIEAVVPVLNADIETRVIGSLRQEGLPRIGWGELLRRAFREPMVWHAHRVNELVVGLLLRLIGKRVRVLWTRHSTGKPTWLTAVLAQRADRLVSVSPEAAQTLGLPSVVVGHGVELERFSPVGEREAAWSALGVGGRFGIGVIGRVRPDKGQGDFVEALAPLLAQYPDWRPALVGLVKERERAWVQGLSSALPRLHLAGEVSDVERWYRGLTVVVVPSHVESFGLTRLEALAAGCCLVTARLNALDRMIEHGKTGYVYEPGDVQGLSAILSELLASPHKALAVGAAGAELAREKLGVSHEAHALLQLYRAALST